MKNARRRSREFALQALYQWQVNAISVAELHNQYAGADGYAKADANLFVALMKGAIGEAENISVQLAPHLDRPWAEVSPVERAVMLLAAYEMTAMPETPYRVIINEAIELAKLFGGTDGHKYVNGVLDKLAAIVRADEIAYRIANEAADPSSIRAPRSSAGGASKATGANGAASVNAKVTTKTRRITTTTEKK